MANKIPTPTKNAVPSADIRDAVFAGAKLDEWATSQNNYYTDRVNKIHLTERGINDQFQQFLLNSGYEILGDYTDGPFVFTRRNQIIAYNGEFYRPKASVDLTSGYATTGNDQTSWAVDSVNFVSVGDAALRSELSKPDSFRLIGSVASFAALRTTIPTTIGQKILLLSHADDGWGAQNRAPKGGGMFVAFNAPSIDDGGTIAVVNSVIHWKRVIDGPYCPEWFGANGDGTDDATKIMAAINAAITAGVDHVKGEGIYTLKSQCRIAGVGHVSPSGLDPRQGFTLSLNIVNVDSASWPNIPDRYWEAQPAFVPISGNALENFDLIIDQFDGGGKATCLAPSGGRINTSSLTVGYMRNYVVGFRNWTGLDNDAGQSTMVTCRGNNWQGGYNALLAGGGAGNYECMGFDVQWVALNRFGAVSLQDRTQYAHIRAGTLDYNGDWLSVLTLTNVVKTTDTDINFGDIVNIGSVTGMAMSNVMVHYGAYILIMRESADKRNGVSDYSVGATVTNSAGTFSATVSAITLTSDNPANPQYVDVISSNMTAAFSRNNITLTYGGGVYGNAMFTNIVWCPNATAGTTTASFMGLQVGGSSAVRYWYEREIFGNNPWLQMDSNGLTISQNIRMAYNRLSGPKADYDMTVGNEESILVLPAAPDITHPVLYEIFSVSSTAGQGGYCLVSASTTGLTVLTKSENFLTYRVDGLVLYATLSTADGTLNTTVTKRV